MEKKKVTLNFILLIAAAVNYARNSGEKFLTSSEGNKNPAGGDSSEIILPSATVVNYSRKSGGKFFTSSEGNKNPAGGDSSEIGGWLGENPLQDEVF